MKVIALTFDYDLAKLKHNGRFWAREVYGEDPNNIFEYSAASYATFLKYNSHIPLHLYTNNIELLKLYIDKYDVDTSNVTYIDYTDQILESKKSKYTFQPIVDLCYNLRNRDEYIIKVDNDLVWRDTIPKLDESKDILLWKFERYVFQGDPRMGEIKVCQEVCGTTDFKEYNIGVFGYPSNYQIEEFYDVCNKMVNVDILPVSDLGTNIYHCCEQTAHCWILDKYNYNIIETHSFIEHNYSNKNECIKQAKSLLK
jgi:hypothetical protein